MKYIPSAAASEFPLGTARHVKIITIGAGASGINMIHTLRKTLINYTHVVYEKNPRVGGTRFENRYTGCKCDIPTHNYQFSWKINLRWSSFFALAPEIENYLERVCDEEGLQSEIKLEHKIIDARWSSKHWEVQVEYLKTGAVFQDSCDFLLDTSGVLNNWKWPDVPGLGDFKGPLIHNANWPAEFVCSGKTVGVIENGSSGVQIVPTLQPDVKRLVHFIRSSTWIVPSQQQTLATTKAATIFSEIEMDKEKFTTSQMEKFESSPEYHLQFVKAVEEELINESEAAKRALQMLTMCMTLLLKNDPLLCAALIPTFPVGCRRLAPAPGYLESLSASNVQIVTDGISKITPEEIETETGELVNLDALVCATGFDVSFCPIFPIINRHNKNIQDLWSKSLPQAYMSLFLGPISPVGHGSILNITEHIAKYIVGAIQKCQAEGISAIYLTHRATTAYNEHIEAFMPRTAWAGTCRSWFKRGKENGSVTALHPGSRIHWFHMLEKFRGKDFEYEWENGKRYGYLGNGFSTKELGDGDKTWYLGKLPSHS